VSRLNERATRVEVVTTLAIIGVFLSILAVRSIRRTLAEHPSHEVCQAMLDRYVEHVTHASNPKPSASDVGARKARARALAAEDQTFARCPTHLTREEADCAMRSINADEFERCLP
jgi:hypothetical protein